MVVYILNKCPEENREGFAAAGGCIHQTTVAVADMFPCLGLECEGLVAFLCQPVRDDLISCSTGDCHGVKGRKDKCNG